jgi:hypothetical protein
MVMEKLIGADRFVQGKVEIRRENLEEPGIAQQYLPRIFWTAKSRR